MSSQFSGSESLFNCFISARGLKSLSLLHPKRSSALIGMSFRMPMSDRCVLEDEACETHPFQRAYVAYIVPQQIYACERHSLKSGDVAYRDAGHVDGVKFHPFYRTDVGDFCVADVEIEKGHSFNRGYVAHLGVPQIENIDRQCRERRFLQYLALH